MGQARARGTYAERKANPKGRERETELFETRRVPIKDFVQLTRYVPRPARPVPLVRDRRIILTDGD